MSRKVNSPSDLFVGWYCRSGDWTWIFLGRTHKPFLGCQLFRFLRVNGSEVVSEFLSQSGVQEYVLSKVCETSHNLS